jgi:hypothetical protein
MSECQVWVGWEGGKGGPGVGVGVGGVGGAGGKGGAASVGPSQARFRSALVLEMWSEVLLWPPRKLPLEL